MDQEIQRVRAPFTYSGQNGADGFAQVSYKVPAKIPAGGGGGGAYLVTAEKIPVTPGALYKIVVGKGGAGGNAATVSGTNIIAGQNGQDGGDSILLIKQNELLYNVTGGKGGTAPSSETAVGKGGDYGRWSYKGYGTTVASVFDTSKGKGTDGSSDLTDVGVVGGRGGASGTGIGGCGGMWDLKERENCAIKSGNVYSVNGNTVQFKYPGAIAKKEYGHAGSGGGGGGWSKEEKTAGKGGDGTDGYVYIYWKK